MLRQEHAADTTYRIYSRLNKRWKHKTSTKLQCWFFVVGLWGVYISVADPERFDAHPDMFLAREKKKFFKIFNYFFQNLTKLVMGNFRSNNDVIDNKKTKISDFTMGRDDLVLWWIGFTLMLTSSRGLCYRECGTAMTPTVNHCTGTMGNWASLFALLAG